MKKNINREIPIPAYYQISIALRDRITQGEWRVGDKLPPEVLLSKEYNVSRMTLRQAMAELTRSGILERKQGSGTFVSPGYFSLSPEDGERITSKKLNDQKNSLRHQVWDELRKVAKPDSRWHWNFEEFVPDFEGSDICANNLRTMKIYQDSELLFIAPDNSLKNIRQAAIEDGKNIIVATYALQRGFKYLESRSIPQQDRKYAATLDGMEEYGKTINLEDLHTFGRIDLLLTGISLVSETGVRWGKGHGYFDLEWAMFRELRLVDENTPIVAVGHDCQVLDHDLEPTIVDTVVDAIITPKRLKYIDIKYNKPKGIYWNYINSDLFARIPILETLKELIDPR